MNTKLTIRHSAFRDFGAILLAAFALLTTSLRTPAQTVWGNALSFDGIDDYVEVLHTEALNAFPLTVSAWINTTNWDGQPGVINKYFASSGDGFNLFLFGGNIRAWYFRNPENRVYQGLDGGYVADGTWHHVAFTVGNDQGKLYVDGALKATKVWTGSPGPPNTAEPLRLGLYPPGVNPNGYFQGRMDEVRIWNVERSQEQIAADMLHPLTGTEPGLVAYWKFDEASGTTAYDSTPNDFDGRLTNSPTRLASTVLELTVLTYNTHLFEDSPLESIIEACNLFTGKDWHDYAYYDGPRRNQIADRIRSSGADIVALQEVWAYGIRSDINNLLNSVYPYSYWENDVSTNCLNGLRAYNPLLPTCIDSVYGSNLPKPVDQARRFNTLGCGLLLLSKYPLSGWGIRRFPTYKNCALGDADQCSLWADKSVLTATANVGGVPIRIGISHTKGDQDEAYRAEVPANFAASGMTTFQLQGDPYLFAVGTNHTGHIIRFEDYSSFDSSTQSTNHAAGWKHVFEGYWNAAYSNVISFDLSGHPYLLASDSEGSGVIVRIDDAVTRTNGWSAFLFSGDWQSPLLAMTSFQLNNHPYVFGVNGSGDGSLYRINDDPATGWSLVYSGLWSFGNMLTSFNLNGHPYLFSTTSGDDPSAFIVRINDDPETGWTYLREKMWPGWDVDDPDPHPYSPIAITAFEWDNHPYICGLYEVDLTRSLLITRINDDPSEEWDWNSPWNGYDEYLTGNFNYSLASCYAIKPLTMAGRPYLFDLRNCCDQAVDNTLARFLPRVSYLWRINDGGEGCELMQQWEELKMIRDETVVEQDGPPAILMGDFNIVADNYGTMDELFHKAGAVDAYVQVHNSGDGGETIDAFENWLLRYFFHDGNMPTETNEVTFSRIDYVYVKPWGSGVRLVPTGAEVLRDWKMITPPDAINNDLSDHYPLKVEFRLEMETGAGGCRLAIRPVPSGWQLRSTGDIGRRYELQWSADLDKWEKLEEFRLTTSPHLCTDTTTPTPSVRFYRLRALP